LFDCGSWNVGSLRTGSLGLGEAMKNGNFFFIKQPSLSSLPLSGHTLLNGHISKTVIMLSIANVSAATQARMSALQILLLFRLLKML
jgi:hypothetical protein